MNLSIGVPSVQSHANYRTLNTYAQNLLYSNVCKFIFKNAPEGSVIILHGCGQNPTGVDPSNEEWIKIANVIKVIYLFRTFKTGLALSLS